MKKITRKNLMDLAKCMPQLSEFEQRECIGGDKFIFNTKGELVERISCEMNSFWVGDKSIVLSGALSVSFESGVGLEGNAVNKEVFEFFAQNTDVEWALSTSGNMQGFLYSSNDESSINAKFAMRKGYDSFYHNHGGNYANSDNIDMSYIQRCPSPNDLARRAEMMNGDYDYQETYIYNEACGDNQYYKYDGNSTNQDQEAYRRGYENYY